MGLKALPPCIGKLVPVYTENTKIVYCRKYCNDVLGPIMLKTTTTTTKITTTINFIPPFRWYKCVNSLRDGERVDYLKFLDRVKKTVSLFYYMSIQVYVGIHTYVRENCINALLEWQYWEINNNVEHKNISNLV